MNAQSSLLLSCHLRLKRGKQSLFTSEDECPIILHSAFISKLNVSHITLCTIKARSAGARTAPADRFFMNPNYKS